MREFVVVSACLAGVCTGILAQTSEELKGFREFIQATGIGPKKDAEYCAMDLHDSSVADGVFRDIDRGWIVEES